jgi:hypothetical protein
MVSRDEAALTYFKIDYENLVGLPGKMLNWNIAGRRETKTIFANMRQN